MSLHDIHLGTDLKGDLAKHRRDGHTAARVSELPVQDVHIVLEQAEYELRLGDPEVSRVSSGFIKTCASVVRSLPSTFRRPSASCKREQASIPTTRPVSSWRADACFCVTNIGDLSQ